jgi:hypothetical protein
MDDDLRADAKAVASKLRISLQAFVEEAVHGFRGTTTVMNLAVTLASVVPNRSGCQNFEFRGEITK